MDQNIGEVAQEIDFDISNLERLEVEITEEEDEDQLLEEVVNFQNEILRNTPSIKTFPSEHDLVPLSHELSGSGQKNNQNPTFRKKFSWRKTQNSKKSMRES